MCGNSIGGFDTNFCQILSSCLTSLVYNWTRFSWWAPRSPFLTNFLDLSVSAINSSYQKIFGWKPSSNKDGERRTWHCKWNTCRFRRFVCGHCWILCPPSGAHCRCPCDVIVWSPELWILAHSIGALSLGVLGDRQRSAVEIQTTLQALGFWGGMKIPSKYICKMSFGGIFIRYSRSIVCCNFQISTAITRPCHTPLELKLKLASLVGQDGK